MTIVFAVPARVHLLDLSGPVHIFYEAAEYGADINLRYCSMIEGVHEAASSCELFFAKLRPFAELELERDSLILIPGLEMHVIQSGEFRKAIRPFLSWLREQKEKGVAIGSICTGSFLLAQAGLLDRRPCTTHWKFSRLLQEQYPRAEVHDNRLFIESGGIYTSAGVASGIDLALYLLEKLFGEKLAMDVAREVVVYLRRGEQDPQLSVFLQYRNHLESRIHQVQSWLSENLPERFTTEQLAGMVHVSPRHLTRLFKKSTGISIGQYVDRLRVEKATKLLRQGQKVSFVTAACGLSSENQLRNLLGKYVGKLPSEVG